MRALEVRWFLFLVAVVGMAQAEDRAVASGRVLNHIVYQATAGDLAASLGDLQTLAPELEGSSAATNISVYTGVSTVISFVDLGDVSPLKAAIHPRAWAQLVKQLPALHGMEIKFKTDLGEQVIEAMGRYDLGLTKGLIAGGGAALLGMGSAGNLLQKGTLLYGGKAVTELITSIPVLSRLAQLVIHPSTPADVRKEASLLMTLAGLLKGKAVEAEAQYRAEIGAPLAPIAQR